MKTVGDPGLLEFMELRLGLPGVESDAIDRILAYRKALGDVAPASGNWRRRNARSPRPA
ncbi:MAG: hypothetical protein J6N50_06505 [Bacteroidales bacterium]|nr:hypothetical protein [Bacteroidales bacterium]MBO6238426.1 hypothetical protein [Bacteroidales bacterium]